MFEKYIKRKKAKENMKLNYKVKSLKNPKVRDHAYSMQDKIRNNIKSTRLQKLALRAIVKAPIRVLLDICKDVMPVVLDTFLDKQTKLMIHALSRLVTISEEEILLLKYLKCYCLNDISVAEKFANILLEFKPLFIYSNKDEISSLLAESEVSNKIKLINSPKENTDIIIINRSDPMWPS